MGKLDKFLDNPRRFATDSRFVRRLALLKEQALARKWPIETRWPARATDQELRSQFVGELASRARVIDLSMPDCVELGVLEDDRPALTDYLFRLQESEELDVRVEAGHSTVEMASQSVLEIDDHILGHQTLRVLISHAQFGKQLLADIQFWSLEDETYIGPRNTRWFRRIPLRVATEHQLFKKGACVHARSLHRKPPWFEPTFPIDVVYTWVNHEDPGWQSLKAQFQKPAKTKSGKHDSGSPDRFRNRDELKYSLRSLMQFAPWVRHIYVVSNCAPPSWLDVEHEKISWVGHEEIFPADALPTFSSHAIESRLQHVPGLSNHFLYMNDDVFLGRPTQPGDFFHTNGISKSFLEEYGAVSGDLHEDDPDYLNAARNGQALLERDFGHTPTALHKHTPFALRKDVLLDIEEKYKVQVSKTTRSRFRSIEDISTASFLYHHYAYFTSRATPERVYSLLIKPHSTNYERMLSQMLSVALKPFSFCLNDGGGSDDVPNWGQHMAEFLEGMFPQRSDLERSDEQ